MNLSCRYLQFAALMSSLRVHIYFMLQQPNALSVWPYNPTDCITLPDFPLWSFRSAPFFSGKGMNLHVTHRCRTHTALSKTPLGVSISSTLAFIYEW